MKVDVSLALLCKNYKVLKMDYKKHPCVRLFHAFGGKNEVKLHFWQIRIQPAKHRPSPREAWTMKYLIEKCFFFKTEATEKKRYIWIVLICIVFATFAIFVWFISSFFLKKIQNKNQTDECIWYTWHCGVKKQLITAAWCSKFSRASYGITVSISYETASLHFLSPPKGGMKTPLLYNVEPCWHVQILSLTPNPSSANPSVGPQHQPVLQGSPDWP